MIDLKEKSIQTVRHSNWAKEKHLFRRRKIFRKNKVEAILASGEPFVLFHYAQKLSETNKTPWILNYIEPWSQNISRQNRLLKLWDIFQEKKALGEVNAILTVSQFVADKISLNSTKAEIHIIPNGFDPEVIKNISKINQNGSQLTISYVGTIHNWHSIEIFFKSFNEFIKHNLEGNVSLNFYGINNQNKIEGILTKYPAAKNFTKFYPKIPNAELLKKLAESNVLLLFNYYSFMGTKIYDYLGLRRKILFCFTNDKDALKLKAKHYNIDESLNSNKELQSDLIRESKSGALVKMHNTSKRY